MKQKPHPLPLHFLTQLRRQFMETLKENATSFNTPENAQLFVAIGASLMLNIFVQLSYFLPQQRGQRQVLIFSQ